MQEIKKQLKKHILYIMETGATPQILPELIRQYEVLDEKYPDSKHSIESVSFVSVPIRGLFNLTLYLKQPMLSSHKSPLTAEIINRPQTVL